MKKVVLPVAAAVVLAGSYVAYPYYSVNRLSAAIRSDDQARLTAMVDWASVRHGLKADLIALMTEAVAQPASYNPGQALGQAMIEMLGPKVVDNIVASYATPAALPGLIRNGGEIDVKAAVAKTAAAMAGGMALGSVSGAPGDSANAAQAPAGSVAGEASSVPAPNPPVRVKNTSFRGLSTMEVAFVDPEYPNKPSVKGILSFEGLRWKLTRIVLPVDEMMNAPQTAERPDSATDVQPAEAPQPVEAEQ
jgi:hypothetical protein